MIADIAPRMARPSLLSIAWAVVVGLTIALQMIREERDPLDESGEPEIFPSVWEKLASGPAVLIAVFLAVVIYGAVKYLPLWP